MKSLSKIKKIYGPPGTGKTTYLLKIVEEEIARKVLPNEIAFLAYTKKAATEAINRASQKFKLDTKEFKYFRTIHSLAFQSLGLSTNDVMKPKHYIEVSEALKVDLQPKDIHDDDGNFIQQDPYLKIIDLSRITGIDLHDTFSKYGHIVGGWRKLEQIAEYLKEYKKVRNLYDFTDMLIEFNLRPEVWPHLEVLIVDEAQDLSLVQWQVITNLITKCKRAYIAGDDDQAIFKWAGADVNSFQSYPGDSIILDKSYRIPQSHHNVANKIVRNIKDRIEKTWEAKDEEGKVITVYSHEAIPYKDKNWLVLARTKYILNKVERFFLEQGYYYSRFGSSSISDRLKHAIASWNKIAEGESIGLEGLKAMYEFMSSGRGVQRNFKKLTHIDDRETFDYEKLLFSHGLLVGKESTWYQALDKIPYGKVMYIRQLMKRGVDIWQRPQIELSTIHGAKGGEADNVVLLLDLSRKSEEALQNNPDDEHRVFYVGATRARKELWLVRSESDREYLEALR
tara:strand:+ start:1130 stop:2656 length:1527 start_codon:yes stop_codon:yes gene_type:complete